MYSFQREDRASLQEGLLGSFMQFPKGTQSRVVEGPTKNDCTISRNSTGQATMELLDMYAQFLKAVQSKATRVSWPVQFMKIMQIKVAKD